jgi:hypothetical protein
VSSLPANGLRLLAFGCLGLMPTAGLPQMRSEPTGAMLQGAFTPTRASFSLREPIEAVLEIRNRLAEPVHLDLGGNHKESLTITITRPDGKKIMSQLPQPFDNFTEIGRVDLAPHQSYSKTLVLNEWESFDHEGTYSVEVAVPVPSDLLNRAEVNLSASTLVRVTPRDPIRIKSACEQLKAKLLGAKPEQREEASLALGFATDDVCFPILAELLRSRPFLQRAAILGLARSGTAPAIAAIVAAWDELDETARGIMWNGLGFGDQRGLLRNALQRAGKKAV